MKIRKGDTVQMILGKDRGKSAKVLVVYPKVKKVLVEGVNVYKRRLLANALKSHNGQDTVKGQIIDIQKPVYLSNVMLVCPTCKRPTRVGMKIVGKGKMRVCKKCGKEIEHEQVKK